MEQTPHESDKSGSQSSTSVQRSEICGIKHLEANVLSLTPEKRTEPLHTKCRKEEAKLPEKYKTLSEFFDRMTSSLRLLSLCKKAPTFRNVGRQVEVLTRRKFSYRHLAQIKFILPEAVQTDKILIHDEKTMCMEPDMNITLHFDVIEGHYEQSAYTALQHIFSSRLFKFISMHPEGCEIPEAELPEPFNKRSDTIVSDVLAMDLSTESLPNIIEAELLNSSHLHPSFSRHFSTKSVDVETEKSQLLASPVPLSSSRNDCMISQDAGCGQQEPSDSSVELFVLEKPLQVTCPPSSTAHESTPMKLALGTEKLVVETPAQATPKRSVTSENKPKTMKSQKWMACNISAKRSLIFSNLEGEESFQDPNADYAEQFEVTKSFIPGETKTNLHFIGTRVKEAIRVRQNKGTILPSNVQESSCCTSKDAVSSRDKIISHQHMPTCLSDLVTIIHHIFQSARFPSITKQELVHKIMMNNLDVVGSKEIEEQLELLEKLVPDWISKNVAPSGDLLYNIKKGPDLNSVRENLI